MMFRKALSNHILFFNFYLIFFLRETVLSTHVSMILLCSIYSTFFFFFFYYEEILARWSAYMRGDFVDISSSPTPADLMSLYFITEWLKTLTWCPDRSRINPHSSDYDHGEHQSAASVKQAIHISVLQLGFRFAISWGRPPGSPKKPTGTKRCMKNTENCQI